jgi:hypothetical protein
MNRRRVNGYETIDAIAASTMLLTAPLYIIARVTGNEDLAELLRTPTYASTAYVLIVGGYEKFKD